LWIPITILGALFQCWRTAMQQKLRGQLSLNAAAVVRYLYGVPFGLAILATYAAFAGGGLPGITALALLWCAAGGLLQIFGTNLLIMSFAPRGFAVGTAYAKTEAVQGAVVALILLGEVLSPLSWLGIAVSVAGVLYLSLAGRNLSAGEFLRATVQPAALCGLGAGFCFSLTAVCIKAANLALLHEDLILRALTALVITNTIQTVVQGSYLVWREPREVRAVFATWRSSGQVGALSAAGSACWFTAFALAPVAMVRALGQVEILFTLAFSRWFLREAPTRADIAGSCIVVGGVVLVLLGR
jgi:drug/metabolite transporter (DMT)-like permease